MTQQNFLDRQLPVVSAAWLNALDLYAWPPGHVGKYLNGALTGAAIQAAATDNAGGTVWLAAGKTYVLTSQIILPPNTDLKVWGDGFATLDCSTALITTPGLIVSLGTLGASLGSGLAATVSAGATSCQTNVAVATLTAGSLVILRNTADSSWNPDRTVYRQGEFLTVKSVSGTTINFSSSVIDTYAGGTIQLNLVTPTSVQISGKIQIVGNTADTANLPTIYIQYGSGCRVDGVTLLRPTSTGIEFSDCYNFGGRDTKVRKMLADAGTIQSTGITAGGQAGFFENCDLEASRHGASTGGGGTVVSRYVKFYKSTLSSVENFAADFHGAAEFCEYEDCTINGAINLSGANNKLFNNDVYPITGVGTMINMEAVLTAEHLVEKNRFYLRTAGFIVDANDTTDINANTNRDGTLKILNNDVFDQSGLDQTYFFLRNNGSTAALRAEIKGNRIIKSDSTKLGQCMSISKVTGSDWTSVVFEDNTLVNAYAGAAAATDLHVRNNRISRAATDTAITALTGNASRIYVEGNDSKGGGALTVSVIGGGASNKLISLKGNTLKDTDPTGNIPVVIVTADLVVCSGNTIGNPADASQTNPISFDTITELRVMADEVYLGTGVPLLASITTLKEHPWHQSYTPTVTLVGGAGNTVPVYTTNSGRWQRIGTRNIVDIELSGDGGAEGAGTGNFTIALPQAASALIAATNLLVGRVTNNALRGILLGSIAASGTTVSLAYWDAIGTNALVTGDTQNNTSRSVSVHLEYEAAA